MRRTVVAFLALASVLALAGSAQAAAGPVANQIEGLFWAITGFAIAVSIVVYGALFWFLIRYRQSANPTPAHIEGNRRLEIIWTVVPTVILIVITAISIPVLSFTDNPPPADTWVNVTAQRFTWQFGYEDGNTTEGVMWIQAGTVVHLNVTSIDVIHSFAVPQLAIKIDALPHRINRWWIHADEAGDFLSQCAEFCGSGHYGMRATIRVFTAEARQEEAARAGVPPKPYGPPPETLPVLDVHMREVGGNATNPYSIVPNNMTFTIGTNVSLRVFNDGSVARDFQIDIDFPWSPNRTGMIQPFENRTLSFVVNVTSAIPVAYGPSDQAARDLGMVGSLTIRSGRIIVIVLREAPCVGASPWCIEPEPPERPLRIQKGEPVVFELQNLASNLNFHNFRMDYPEFEVFFRGFIDAGDPPVFFGPFTFNEDWTGKYWCDVAGHRSPLGMENDYVVGAGSERATPVPIFDMMVITSAIGVPATFAYLFHHARRRDDD